MTLKNVSYVKAQKMTKEQRIELKIEVGSGLVAIETHNEDYQKKAVPVKKGRLVNYVLNGN